MAVFKEKNGAVKAGADLRGRSIARTRPGLLTFEQNISPHLHVARNSGRDSASERNVCAAATASNGSIRKGGDTERKS